MHVTLVSPDPAFAADWQRWRQQKEALRYMPLQPATTESLRRRLIVCNDNLATLRETEYRWFVACGSQIVGTVALSNVNLRSQTAEVSYHVDRHYQGRRIGTAAVRELIERAFTISQLRRLFATISCDNSRSLRLITRLGFQREGVLRAHYIVQGKAVDQVIFGLLRNEWHQGVAGVASAVT